MNSLKTGKVRNLEVSQALPGHRHLFEGFAERIDELKAHHGRGLEEVMEILEKAGPQNAFEVVSQMTWDLTAKSWADFPVA